MSFPDDLRNVKLFKIHPAIGIARIANNDDYFIFGAEPGAYKSNKRIKRQAVQFRIFAYGDNFEGLGELTTQVMSRLGIAATWSAKVGNRKIAWREHTPLGGTQFVISAEASAGDVNNGVLVGSLPDFIEGAHIALGQITSTGVFIPPKGGVFRRHPGDEIEDYPANSKNVADTSSDGFVQVRLLKDGAQLDVLPACIIVGPQDFSPDDDPSPTLYEYFRDQLQVPGIPAGNLFNQQARALDEAALRPCTSDFNPGVEVGLGRTRTEVVDLRSVFYDSTQDPRVDPREMRIRYRTTPDGPGAVPGQLTSGLCSSWQGDYQACIGYWVQHLPETAFLDEDTTKQVHPFRKIYANSGPPILSTGTDIDRHIDEVGIVRIRDHKPVETERDPGDDIG